MENAQIWAWLNSNYAMLQSATPFTLGIFKLSQDGGKIQGWGRKSGRYEAAKMIIKK